MRKSYHKIIGYLLMGLALLIPIYCFGQMVYQSLSKESHYQAYQASLPKKISLARDKKIASYNHKLNQEQNIVDPFLGEAYHVQYGILDNPDAIYGYLAIPSLDLLEPVYLGADDRHMILGLAHVDGTALPSYAKTQRTVIAGHRGYPIKVFFRYINRLRQGDMLYFNDGKETFSYQMIQSEIIFPSEWEKLTPQKGQNLLTLITCDPIPTYNKRLLVHFKQVKKSQNQKFSEKTKEEARDKDPILRALRTTKSKVSARFWFFVTIVVISAIGFVLVLYRLVRYCLA
ncbi:TPA: class C sortase [Streptococcus pyogenes]|uniref:class C sortase n=1 Tax=Streptococcus pyogenes TaxID=1314 RepID=UPI0010EC8F80|nr:class C sortase [Streptococcus pyogenes]VGY24656.1 sortase [Streptococcus pyogenes]VGY58109.1 sortase [Streptococcus pyogenes]VHH43441.1 sortase [Streptococcus pyogenes]VHK50314.1 sortase [Streptococcus pyogenes]VHK89288.1 sortase [Streptococcus pyogenes]